MPAEVERRREHVILDHARNLVHTGETINVVVLRSWTPDEASSSSTPSTKYLPLSVGTRITLKRDSGNGWWFAEKPDGAQGWCPETHFTCWEIVKVYAMEENRHRHEFLDVKEGDYVHALEVYAEGDWSGWGRGQKMDTNVTGLFRMGRYATGKVVCEGGDGR